STAALPPHADIFARDLVQNDPHIVSWNAEWLEVPNDRLVERAFGREYPRKRTSLGSWARSGMGQKRHIGLLDHLVSARQHGRWYREPERFGFLKIEHEPKWGGLLARQIGWLLPSQEAVNIAR